MCGSQWDHAVAAEPKPVHSAGQLIRVSTNSGINAPLANFVRETINLARRSTRRPVLDCPPICAFRRSRSPIPASSRSPSPVTPDARNDSGHRQKVIGLGPESLIGFVRNR